ncbi:MAG: hypothetical protein RL728_1095 [Bacteroidota bacterium]|jgi:hypothetical protein
MKNVSAIIIASLIFVGGAIYYFYFYLKSKVTNTSSPITITDNPVLSTPPVVLPQLTCKDADNLVRQIFTKQGGQYKYAGSPIRMQVGFNNWGTETAETKILKKQLADSNFEPAFGCPDELDGRCVNGYIYARKTKKLTVLEADALAIKIKTEEKWANDKPTININPGSELRGQLYRGGWKFDPSTYVLVQTK